MKAEINFKKDNEIIVEEQTEKLLKLNNEKVMEENGLELKFKGKFTGKTILERMLNYVNNLEDAGNYTIDFKVKENL
jgi:hypothetical protein